VANFAGIADRFFDAVIQTKVTTPMTVAMNIITINALGAL
jgi:hypothetical protein